MATLEATWKKGRGKLGFMDPLLGQWQAQADSPLGVVHCVRTFSRVLNGKFVQLSAVWEMAQGNYEETAYIGVRPDGRVGFWSFTSDGKQAEGFAVDATDVHPLAIGFQAQMPAGVARMVYWPDAEHGVHWVVESQTKKGWNRFTHHQYVRVEKV